MGKLETIYRQNVEKEKEENFKSWIDKNLDRINELYNYYDDARPSEQVYVQYLWGLSPEKQKQLGLTPDGLETFKKMYALTHNWPIREEIK